MDRKRRVEELVEKCIPPIDPADYLELHGDVVPPGLKQPKLTIHDLPAYFTEVEAYAGAAKELHEFARRVEESGRALFGFKPANHETVKPVLERIVALFAAHWKADVVKNAPALTQRNYGRILNTLYEEALFETQEEPAPPIALFCDLLLEVKQRGSEYAQARIQEVLGAEMAAAQAFPHCPSWNEFHGL
jgi:hypothetical protein